MGQPQVMDDHIVKSFPGPSLFRTLVLRQVRPLKVCQLPYEGEWTSYGEKKGGGVLTVHNQRSYRGPPLTLSFAKKRWNGQMLAAADEEGYVSILKTGGELPSMADCYSTTRDLCKTRWMAHTNAVFDVCWTKDDTHVLTASGDQTVRIWDIEAKRGVGAMAGHTGSVKSICVHPSQSDLFMSGSRDGCVMFWDLRILSGLIDETKFPGCPKYMPVTKIKDAHKGLMNAKRRKGYTRSVTSVLYLKDERIVATAGANDGVVKFWDTRKLKIPVAHTPSIRASSGARMHGIAGLSQDPTGTRLIATSVDSKIYMYDVMALAKGELKTFSGHSMGSFYIKASFSPDGSHVLGGSTDHHAYIWKVDGPESPPTLLTGHNGEVTAVDWCPTDHCKVATCSDDCTVRVWKLKAPRFSLKPPATSSGPPSRLQEEEMRLPNYSFINLAPEDSQHRLPAKLSQGGMKLQEARTDRDLNTLRLVEDSQHPLPTTQLQFIRAMETNMDASPKSLHTESNHSSQTEKMNEPVCSRTTFSLDSMGVHGGSGATPHVKRTRVLFRGGEDPQSENNSEQSAHDVPSKENSDKFGASYFSAEEGARKSQVSPSFNRTRVPLRKLNGYGVKNIEIQHSTAASKHFVEYLPENATSSLEFKKILADKHSTPPLNRAKTQADFTEVAASACEGQTDEHSSPLGLVDGSPSSVLSPPTSTQRRRKTIMDYFRLQPPSTESARRPQ